MKFTIEKSNLPDTFRIKSEDQSVALICGTMEYAQLFAAAPEMLLSLKNLVYEMGHALKHLNKSDQEYLTNVLNHSEKLINKAQGK